MEQVYSVGEFQAVCNQILDTAFAGVVIEGEVASFKVNQGKYVFFDLKDEEASVGCFIMLFALKYPLEDGMRVRVRAVPKVTAWGKFSLTVQAIMPVGEGSLKKSFELLKKKLEKEGLFDVRRKRGLPAPESIRTIGVISSTQAAGYADFCKILNERWGGLKVLTAHCQVQGMVAAEQIVRALKYFNEKGEVDVIAIMRGGGSADDLAAFNDEELVRAIAGSKIRVVTGIGHEVDESLADLAADFAASTPSNVAQVLTRDRREVVRMVRDTVNRTKNLFSVKIREMLEQNRGRVAEVEAKVVERIEQKMNEIVQLKRNLEQVDPERVLERGYVLVRGEWVVGEEIEVIGLKKVAKAKIEKVSPRKA